MWIQGRRRGGAKALSKHLQKTDENESVKVCALEGFAFDAINPDNLEKALKEMEAIGYGKGDKRNLFHVIVAPAYGETLNAAQRKFMIAYYAEHMGFKNYPHAVVEHWKKGKQHFHLVFNIINPATGKTHELKWSKQKEWRISRGLEEIFGFVAPVLKGKASRTWEMQRGKRTGIDPRKMRKEVTAIFQISKTAQEFAAALGRARYTLTRDRGKKLLLVDRFGDTHGLMRRIEGKKLADLRQKFYGIEHMPLPDYDTIVKARKSTKGEADTSTINPQQVRTDIQKAYHASATGAAFFAALNQKEYALDRGLNGFGVIDRNGNRYDISALLGKEYAQKLHEKFPDLSDIYPRPLPEIIRRIYAQRSLNSTSTSSSRDLGTDFYRAIAAITTRRTNATPQLSRPSFLTLSFFAARSPKQNFQPAMHMLTHRRCKKYQNIPDSEKFVPRRPDADLIESLIWAWEQRRRDILLQYGIALPEDFEF